LSSSRARRSSRASAAAFPAEALTFGEVSTGAQNDLQRAADIARRMVKEYGMSQRIVDETGARVRDILTKRDGDLKAIAQRLLEEEVLEGDELHALLGERKTVEEGGRAS